MWDFQRTAVLQPINEKQREQLNTLLSSDFDELWAGILGQ